MRRILELLTIVQILIHQKNGFATSEALVGHPHDNNIRDVDKSELPAVAFIQVKEEYHSSSKRKCAGTLISKSHVLTIEHCFEPQTLTKHLEVLIGSSHLDKCLKYDVRSRAVYKEWSKLNGKTFDPVRDDITVLTLMTRVRLWYVKPFILSTMKDEEAYGKTVQTAGWGTPTGIDASLTMKPAFLTILSRNKCKNILKNHNLNENSLPDTHLCSKADPFVLLTKGDSGGPLFHKRNRLIAINRSVCPVFAPQCSRVNMHISIDHYREFIGEALKNF